MSWLSDAKTMVRVSIKSPLFWVGIILSLLVGLYNVGILRAQTAEQRILYGRLFSLAGDSLENAKVTLTLSGKQMFYTTRNVVCSGQQVAYTDASGSTNKAGFFRFVVYGTDSLMETGWATVGLTVEHPSLQMSGGKVDIVGLTVAADSTDSISLGTVLAQ